MLRKLFQKMKERGRYFKNPQELVAAAREWRWPYEKMQEAKRQSSYTYSEGPMYWLGQQIVKAMQDAGYPAKIFVCYRPPEVQLEAFQKGRSKAKPWHSPHQYLEAVDIIHPGKAWSVSAEYWKTLRAVGQIVADKHGVELVFGYDWGWDSAHIELKDWRQVKKKHFGHKPTAEQLWKRFHDVLPAVAKRYERDHWGPPPQVQTEIARRQVRTNLGDKPVWIARKVDLNGKPQGEYLKSAKTLQWGVEPDAAVYWRTKAQAQRARLKINRRLDGAKARYRVEMIAQP